MGCDIHLYFERKNKEGKWEAIDIPENLVPDERYYDVFVFLAGVRNCTFDAQFKDRGFPENCSYKKENYDENDDKSLWLGDHSFTYAYLDEILRAPWEEAELQDCYFYIFCSYVLPRICDYCGYLSEEEKRNIRIIMGFDN